MESQSLSGAPGRLIDVELERDYRSLLAGVGFRLMADRLVVSMTGDDRVAFMHGMCSNDVSKLQPGDLVYALLLTEHAHIVGDFYLMAREGELVLEIDRGLWPGARAHLEKFLVADDVEFEEGKETQVVGLLGPSAADALVAAGLPGAPAPWHHATRDDVTVANFPRFGSPALALIAEKSRTDELVGRLASAGITEVGSAALEIIRVENGVARLGVDTGEKTIALEARLESAISFDKGCYVGQETIERATARGAVKKRLFGLRFGQGRLPEPNAAVMLDGKEVGRVTSAVRSPRLGALGLAIVHHSAWEVGTQVTVRDSAGELQAAMSNLPFE